MPFPIEEHEEYWVVNVLGREITCYTTEEAEALAAMDTLPDTIMANNWQYDKDVCNKVRVINKILLDDEALLEHLCFRRIKIAYKHMTDGKEESKT